uniref:Uncharacterized protein n=1 Tax=Parascaris univalens TaxID=6257 RepID=A0A915C8S1_PARUN
QNLNFMTATFVEHSIRSIRGDEGGELSHVMWDAIEAINNNCWHVAGSSCRALKSKNIKQLCCTTPIWRTVGANLLNHQCAHELASEQSINRGEK